jgi:hypothetical protein
MLHGIPSDKRFKILRDIDYDLFEPKAKVDSRYLSLEFYKSTKVKIFEKEELDKFLDTKVKRKGNAKELEELYQQTIYDDKGPTNDRLSDIKESISKTFKEFDDQFSHLENDNELLLIAQENEEDILDVINQSMNLGDILSKTENSTNALIKEQLELFPDMITPYDDATSSIKKIIPHSLSLYLSNIDFKDSFLHEYTGDAAIPDIFNTLEAIDHIDLELEIENDNGTIYIKLDDSIIFRLESLIPVINKIKPFDSYNLTFIHFSRKDGEIVTAIFNNAEHITTFGYNFQPCANHNHLNSVAYFLYLCMSLVMKKELIKEVKINIFSSVSMDYEKIFGLINRKGKPNVFHKINRFIINHLSNWETGDVQQLGDITFYSQSRYKHNYFGDFINKHLHKQGDIMFKY